MQVVERDIESVIPYEHNPRINDKAVDAVAASIAAFGFKNPIIVDRGGYIIAGHTRLKAAQKLGMKTVPVISADDLTDEQVKAFRLADNKTAELAEWDTEALELELAEISEIDMSAFGFDVADLLKEPEEDDFEIEPPEEPETKLGDIYALGEHRLICGNSKETETFERLMGEDRADLVFTDPPYGVAIGSKNETLNSVQKAGRILENIENDTLSEDELYDLLKDAFVNVRTFCKEDASYYVTSPQGGSLGLMMMMMMRDAGLEVRHILIWRKNSPTFSIGRLDYDYQHEPIFYTWTKSHHNYRKGENRSTVWDYDKPRKCDLHPTMKPVALIQNAILDGTRKDDIVLDAFGGSGSTLIACEQSGRRCRMIELDPKYCDVIVKRWETYTGKKAEKIEG